MKQNHRMPGKVQAYTGLLREVVSSPDLGGFHSSFLFCCTMQQVGVPGGAVVKNLPDNVGRCKRHGFYPWVGKIPWRRKWQPTPTFLPGESHGQRGAWRGAVHSIA